MFAEGFKAEKIIFNRQNLQVRFLELSLSSKKIDQNNIKRRIKNDEIDESDIKSVIKMKNFNM